MFTANVLLVLVASAELEAKTKCKHFAHTSSSREHALYSSVYCVIFVVAVVFVDHAVQLLLLYSCYKLTVVSAIVAVAINVNKIVETHTIRRSIQKSIRLQQMSTACGQTYLDDESIQIQMVT